MTELQTLTPDLRQRIDAFTQGDRFGNFIMSVIVFNAIVLGLETSRIAEAHLGAALQIANGVCLAIFLVEIALKLFARRWGFFRNAWNIFDFIVVLIAILPATGGLSVLRALRVLRIMRMISMAPALRRTVDGFVRALPGMGSVFLLMALIFYIGSVMATRLFGETHPQWFGTVGESAYSLFQIMTLESWSMGIVRPVMETHPQAWAFFVPFILMTSFAVVNLLVGLVVNSMQSAYSEEADSATDAYRDAVLAKLDAIETRLDRLETGRAPAGGGDD